MYLYERVYLHIYVQIMVIICSINNITISNLCEYVFVLKQLCLQENIPRNVFWHGQIWHQYNSYFLYSFICTILLYSAFKKYNVLTCYSGRILTFFSGAKKYLKKGDRTFSLLTKKTSNTFLEHVLLKHQHST